MGKVHCWWECESRDLPASLHLYLTIPLFKRVDLMPNILTIIRKKEMVSYSKKYNSNNWTFSYEGPNAFPRLHSHSISTWASVLWLDFFSPGPGDWNGTRSHWAMLLLCHHFQTPSLVAQLVKNPPAMQELLVRFLGQENLLEKD